MALVHPRRVSGPPIIGRAIVIVQLLFPLAVPPVILRIARKGRSPLQLIERDVGSISAQPGIVGQLPPGDRVLFRANPKKSAEGHDRIGDTSADLVTVAEARVRLVDPDRVHELFNVMVHGMLDVDLRSNIAAEARAKIVYELDRREC